MNSPVKDININTISNNQEKVVPFISLLIYHYDGQYLARCLEKIFSQSVIPSFEVVIADDLHDSLAWDVAVEYEKKYRGKVTLSRNNIPLGMEANSEKGLMLCRGKYTILLAQSADFDTESVVKTILNMEKDEFLEHAFIKRMKSGNPFIPKVFIPERVVLPRDLNAYPLVSICIYNYNYGRYLRECIESVFNQTYQNIEICFSDNASTDDSWEIALEYVQKYPNRVNVIRNRQNYGPATNIWNCMMNVHGKYVLKLCSDDAMKPNFIERCVTLMEQHPDAGFTMVHREIIDENSQPLGQEAPFYASDCLIPSSGQTAVYMMSSVNPSVSQIFYRTDKLDSKRMSGNLNDRWLGDRIMDFNLSCSSPILYIKDALLLNRMHGQSDSSLMDKNLLQCLGEYVLVHQLSDIAATFPGLEETTARLPEALDKLAKLCLRYTLRNLINNQTALAKRYLHLALAIEPEIERNEVYIKLQGYWHCIEEEKANYIQTLISNMPEVNQRQHSYPPPEGSICFD
jgi:glycosyltransferase involved in cell wall biosynthesis